MCESFRSEIKAKLGEFLPGAQVNFRDIFKWVLRTACTRPLTLVIDEFQDLRRCDPAIYSEMQREWDEYQTRAKINLIVCGSVNTLMNRIFRDDKEPLYGRETAFLKIAPFPTETLKEILADHASAATPDDLLALYALTGGIAKYVALLMDHGAAPRDRMFDDMVSEGSLFIEEGKAGLIEEFGKDYGTYFSILSAIACGRTTRKDIENAVGVGDLGGFLQRLEKDYEIIARHHPLFGKPLAKNLRYRILDNFYLFWFRFIAKYSAAVELGTLGDMIRGTLVHTRRKRPHKGQGAGGDGQGLLLRSSAQREQVAVAQRPPHPPQSALRGRREDRRQGRPGTAQAARDERGVFCGEDRGKNLPTHPLNAKPRQITRKREGLPRVSPISVL